MKCLKNKRRNCLKTIWEIHNEIAEEIPVEVAEEKFKKHATVIPIKTIKKVPIRIIGADTNEVVEEISTEVSAKIHLEISEKLLKEHS